jgi:hypothetical protein
MSLGGGERRQSEAKSLLVGDFGRGEKSQAKPKNKLIRNGTS